MTTLSNNAEGATTGVELTISNQGASGDVLTVNKSGTASIQAVTTGALVGTKSYRIVTNAAGEAGYLWWTVPSWGQSAGRVYYYIPTAPTVDLTLLVAYNGGQQAGVILRVAGRVALTDATAAYIWQSAVGDVLTFPCTIGVDLTVDPGTTITDGKAKLQVFDGLAATTPRYSSGEFTGNFLRTTGLTASWRLGNINAAAAQTMIVDAITVNDSYGFIGPLSGVAYSGPSTALAVTANCTANGPVGRAQSVTVSIDMDIAPVGSTNPSRDVSVDVGFAVDAAGVVGNLVIPVTAVLTGFEVFSPFDPSTRAILTGFEVYGAGPTTGSTAVLTGFEVYGDNATLLAVLGGPDAVEPDEVFELTLASSPGSPTTYRIDQTAGPNCSLTGSGSVWTARAPLLLPDPADDPIMASFTGTVTKAGDSSSSSWSLEIYPHTMWRRVGDHLEPVLMYTGEFVPQIPGVFLAPSTALVATASTSATGLRTSQDVAVPSTPVTVTAGRTATGKLTTTSPSTALAVSAARSAGGSVALPTSFSHPGVVVSNSMLTFVTTNRASAPWSTNLATLRNTYPQSLDTVNNVGKLFNDPTWTPHPQAIVLRTTSGGAGSSGDKAELTDATAALVDALLFVYDSDRTLGNKAVEIINAWSAVLTDHQVDATYTDGENVAAWAGSMFARAAEIMRARWVPTGGENVLNVAALTTCFRGAFLPRLLPGHAAGGAGLLASMAEAILGIGVFLDDRAVFQTGLDYWRNWVSAFIWRPGDVNAHSALVGYPHSAVTTAWDVASPVLSTFISSVWKSPTGGIPWPEFIFPDEGTDPWHAGTFLASLANGAETAWHQGIDLYAEQQTRLVGAVEKYAAWVADIYADHVNPPTSSTYPWAAGWTTLGTNPTANMPHRATLEIIYNHYHGRLGLSLPNTLDCLTRYQRTGTYIIEPGAAIVAERVTHQSNTAGRTYGDAMPVGDLDNWHQVSAIDFIDLVPIGGFRTSGSSVLVAAGAEGYAHYGPGRPGGAILEMYPDGWNSGTGGKMSPSQVCSVINVPGANGVLDLYVHTGLAQDGTTMPLTNTIHPLPFNGTNHIGPYFRYKFRLRTTGFTVNPSRYSTVPLTIDSATWPASGELDWPEGEAHQNALINGWYHRADPAGSQQSIPNMGGRARKGDWHVYDVECVPGRVTFTCDDAVHLTSTVMTPTESLLFVLQHGIDVNPNPLATTVGHIQYDWVVCYDYVVPEVPQAVSTAGALPPGQQTYPVPSGALFVDVSRGSDTTGNGTQATPYATLAKAAASVVVNGSIVLRGYNATSNPTCTGIYHEGETSPGGNGVIIQTTGVTVQSYPGEAVWFDGSSVLTGWVSDTTSVPGRTVWKKTGMSLLLDRSATFTRGADDSTTPNWNFVDPNFPAAPYAEQVFVDGVALTQVATLAEVTTGKFYAQGTLNGVAGANKYRFTTTTMFIGTDPTGKEIRSSDRTSCMMALADNVTLKGFGVRRYATCNADFGALKLWRAGCFGENLTVTQCAATGISVGSRANTILRSSTITYCGSLGVHSNNSDNQLLDRLLVTNCNTEHFMFAPASGGIKVTRSLGIRVTDCVVKNNHCHGLWADESVYQFYVTGCDIQDNDGHGLIDEIGADLIFGNNRITGNGKIGCYIIGTDNAFVWNNTICDNAEADLNFTQDARRPGTDAGRDTRQPYPASLSYMTWVIDSASVGNNVIGKSPSTGILFRLRSTESPPKIWSTFGASVDGNVYVRNPAGTPTNGWGLSSASSSAVGYSTFAAYKAAGTGLDTHSVNIEGSDPMDSEFMLTSAIRTANAAVPRALPAGVADLVGKPTGTTYLGAWRGVGSMSMHYDADSLTGANGSAVTSWPDTSGKNLPPLAQVTVASQPVLAVGAVNGHNAITWTPGDCLYASGTALDVFRNKTASMVFIAFTQSTNVDVNDLLSVATPSATNRVLIQARASSGNVVSASGRRLDADAINTVDSTTAAALDVPHVITVRYLWATAAMYVYLDGVLVASDTTFSTPGSTSDTAALAMYVGASLTGTTDNHNGQIMEIIAWDIDDATIRSSTEAALKAKYGIA